MKNILVVNPGFGPGIDFRGQAYLENISVILETAHTSGVRFRGSDFSGNNGLGGERSILKGFRIQGIGNGTIGTNGVVTDNSRIVVSDGFISGVKDGLAANGLINDPAVGEPTDVIFKNIFISDVFQGAKIGASNVQVRDVLVDGAADGFFIQVHPDHLSAPTLTNVTVQNATGTSFHVQDTVDAKGEGTDFFNCTSCRSISAHTGFRITSDGAVLDACMATNGWRGARILDASGMEAEGTRIEACYFALNTNGNYDFNGTTVTLDNNLSF